MHATVESKNNFKELRRELLRDEPPCIPYLGNILRQSIYFKIIYLPLCLF